MTEVKIFYQVKCPNNDLVVYRTMESAEDFINDGLCDDECLSFDNYSISEIKATEDWFNELEPYGS